MNKNFYAVIMAGGTGTRLWPVSRKEKPKQFQKFTSTHQAPSPTTPDTQAPTSRDGHDGRDLQSDPVRKAIVVLDWVI